jgi:cytochrome c oxidase accessory protein FixG
MFTLTTYKSQRRVVQILSTLFILILPFLNIMRLDIPTMRFIFFSSTLWIDEFYIIFLVAMLLLWIIVIFSMLYGRVWCGWVCPQIVLSELHGWFERKTNRWLNIRSRGAGWGPRLIRHGLIFFLAVAISLVIGFNLVAYFVDPYRMLSEIAGWKLGPITTGCILGIALLVAMDILFWRERFCSHACPYGMLQTVITDSRTQIVRYQTERDSECIGCKACVRDCMMGIDIRTSPYQTECIHCGDCIDSCTAVLSRLKRPIPRLISFSWGEQEAEKVTWYQKLGLVDSKRWIILAITAAYAVVLVGVIHLRQPLALTASGDRSTLYHLSPDGKVFNEYALTISNRSVSHGWFSLLCQSAREPQADCLIQVDQNPVFLQSREVKNLKMTIFSSGRNLNPGPNPIQLKALNKEDQKMQVQTEIVFFMPELEASENKSKAL